jgi:hypothetical protein
LVQFVVFGIYFSRLGILYQEKSGNPGPQSRCAVARVVLFAGNPVRPEMFAGKRPKCSKET